MGEIRSIRFKMNKLILLFTMVSLACAATGQELCLRDYYCNQWDSLAYSNPRFDNNNELCAMVVLDAKNIFGIKVRGMILDSLRVGDTLYVYVPNRTKRLTINSTDHLPFCLDLVQLFHNNHGAVGGLTYHVSLMGNEPTNTKQERSKESNYLIFKSQVPISRLVVNGKEWAVTNFHKFSRLVPCGQYHYTASSIGHPDVKGSVVVIKSIGPVEVSLDFLK